jgi:hypothetical protein
MGRYSSENNTGGKCENAYWGTKLNQIYNKFKYSRTVTVIECTETGMSWGVVSRMVGESKVKM